MFRRPLHRLLTRPSWPSLHLSRALTTVNPRLDPITNTPMTISITPTAISRLNALRANDPDNPNNCLRVLVEAGGCHGFQYHVSLDKPTDEDTVFEEDGARVAMDESSLELLKGSAVDWEQALIGSSFVVKNPKAKSSCGCGTSFDVEF